MGGDPTLVLQIQKLGYENVADTFEVVDDCVSVYDEPVTFTGLVKVVVFEIVRVVPVLFLCIGSVNVKVPLTYPLPDVLFKEPPADVNKCEVLLLVKILLTLVE